jgi:hypothetical protein
MKVEFYDKDGLAFTDELKIVPKYNMDEIWSASREGSTCAKVESADGSDRYFVKKCTTGGNGGSFLSPYGAFSNANDLSRVDRASGRRYYEYEQVSKDVFDNYIKFLSTRNPAYFNYARRLYFEAGGKRG